MLSTRFSFLPFFLSAFGVRLHLLLCTPLIVFLPQLHTTNHHSSFSMVKPLTTPLFGFLVILVLSLFLLKNEQSSSLVLVSIFSLIMVYLKRGFTIMIPFLIAFVSPVMLSFENIVLSRVFSSFLCPLPQSLQFLLIFSLSLSWTCGGFFDIGCLFRWIISSSIPTYDPLVLDPMAPPSPESLIVPELCRSTQVSIHPPYLTDYHCSFALATLYEPHTYREAHTDPLW